MSLLDFGIESVERGYVPDAITRIVIRRLCASRLDGSIDEPGAFELNCGEFLETMKTGPIALVPDLANQQHYEVPPEFFQAVLGPRLKYSCCYFDAKETTLARAEEAALAITCERAEIQDGQDILELGCGWGSLTLWMAEHYPESRITAVSNSAPQRRFIESVAASRGLSNVRVITSDMNDFSATPQAFDRVVSVEMFEHMRNYKELLARIAGWLRPSGKLFVHVFCHRTLLYPFETDGAADWMGRYFFTGGIMPSADLLNRFEGDLKVSRQFTWDGVHYQRTAEAWLANLDDRKSEVLATFTKVYGSDEARRWFHRWRMFFLAVSELFGFDHGREWYVSHTLMERAR